MTYGAMSRWNQNGWKHSGRYYYFDLHAGPGVHPEYGDGSPLIFCDAADRFTTQHPEFRYQALMTEVNADNREKLQRELDRRRHVYATARHSDNREVLTEFANPRYHNAFGLFYLDPTGLDDMPWTELARCVNYWKRADVLIRIAASSVKRAQHCNGHKRLSDYLYEFNKQTRCVMEPVGQHQWTFVYLTNGKPIEWKRRRFYNVDSTGGQQAWARITQTAKERQQHDQPSLF